MRCFDHNSHGWNTLLGSPFCRDFVVVASFLLTSASDRHYVTKRKLWKSAVNSSYTYFYSTVVSKWSSSLGKSTLLVRILLYIEQPFSLNLNKRIFRVFSEKVTVVFFPFRSLTLFVNKRHFLSNNDNSFFSWNLLLVTDYNIRGLSSISFFVCLFVLFC